MKSIKSFLCLSIFAFLSVSYADEATNLLEWAKTDLNLSRSESSLAAGAREREKAEILDEIDKLESEIQSLRKEYEDVQSLNKAADNVIALSRFKEGRMGEIKTAFASFSGDENLPLSDKNFLAKAAEILDVECSKILTPYLPSDSVATDLKGEILKGKIFRIGGFSYFVSGSRAGFISPDSILYGENYSQEIISFLLKKSDSIPADLSGGKLLESSLRGCGFSDDIRLGGIWMWPILFFGFLSLSVCVVKAARFYRIKRAPEGIVKKIFAALDKDSEISALRVCRLAGKPYEDMLADLVKSRTLAPSMLEEISYEHMLLAGEKLFSGLSILSVSAAVAPLFGLLGTVTGIIKTFGDLSSYGAEQAQAVSAGISEALITTEYGLIVAIPAFVAHALFSRRAKGIMSDMEKLASGFLGGLSK